MRQTHASEKEFLWQKTPPIIDFPQLKQVARIVDFPDLHRAREENYRALYRVFTQTHVTSLIAAQ